MSEIKITKENENVIFKNINHFNNILKEKLNKNDLFIDNQEKDNFIGNKIYDKSEIFLAEYNNDRMLQYSHLYYLRLKLVKEKLIELSKNKWPKERICENILETKENVKN